jgi:hypothetical protein
MSGIEVFDGSRLVEIATCHHPISALPRTLTGLGKVFLGVAQLRAQNKLFELEAIQLQHDRAYKEALVAAQKELGLATLENQRLAMAADRAAAERSDVLAALRIQVKNADLERRHQRKLLLIEDSYRLARVILMEREREVRHSLANSRVALAVTAEATRGVREALNAATSFMIRPNQTLVQEQSSQLTVRELSSDLRDLGTSATVTLGKLLDASAQATEIAFRGIYELRS